jgi:hypothetical protein
MKISFANSGLATWLTRAVSALRKRNMVQVRDTALSVQNVQQITSGWDYRPRGVVRQESAFDCGEARNAEVTGASTPKENDDAWFNFASYEATAEQPPIPAPLSDDAREV